MDQNKQIFSSDLLKYIPRTVLDEVCNSMADVTNIFTGIEDFRGVMVSLSTGELSCKLCRQRRIRVVDTMTCRRIDTFASIEASRQRNAIMYICPYGLIDMCAPIIIGDRLQGAIFMGMILTDQEGMDSLQQFNIPIDDNYEGEKELARQYREEKKNMKSVPFHLIKLYVNLVDTAAKYLSELGTRNMLEDEIVQMEKTIAQLETKQKHLQGSNLYVTNQLSSHLAIREFTLESLNSVNQMAILEDAPETKKGLQNLMQLLQYISNANNVFTILDREISYMEKYIELQQIIRSQVKISVDIHITHMEVIVPQFLLIRLIENAYYHAFTPESEEPKIHLSITEENGNIVIVLQDNGIGTPNNISTGLLQYMLDSTNIPDHKGALFLILRNMKYLYQESFHFDIDSKKNEGTSITLLIPNRRPEND